MLTFVKLGGSLITDKQTPNTFRPDVAARVAGEIGDALREQPELRLVIGHGSGSFGHVVARQYNTINGVHTPEEWRGFAEVSAAVLQLGSLMAVPLIDASVPIMRLQPSASARSHDGELVELALMPVVQALEHGLVPLVYGDIAFDDVRGGTIISTESLFFFLAQKLPVARIFILGEVEGVYDSEGKVIPAITPATLPHVEEALSGSAGTDVTGGMETKVRDMVALVERVPTVEIRIMSGTQPGLLRDALLGLAQPGTRIHRD